MDIQEVRPFEYEGYIVRLKTNDVPSAKGGASRHPIMIEDQDGTCLAPAILHRILR